MYRASLMTLVFSFLTFLAISCAPGPHTSCPAGQVIPEGGNTCVENTCINYPCDENQHCVVGQTEPYCVCDAGYESDIDTSGATTPVLVCIKKEATCNGCTGYNTHCDANLGCVCDDGYLEDMNNEGMHPVLDCVLDPCYDYECPAHQMCQAEFNEEEGRWIPICDYE